MRNRYRYRPRHEPFEERDWWGLALMGFGLWVVAAFLSWLGWL